MARILVVDDEELLRDSAKMFLEHRGHEVMVASSAIEALRILKKKETEFDLIISDYRMPGVTGVELLHAIRVWAKRDTPFVLVSGDTCSQNGNSLLEICASWGVLFVPKGVPKYYDKILAALPNTKE